MSIEELNQKYFSRERIRNRMMKRAAEYWGFAESEMDDFDPLVTLLIEACAVEFEKISGESAKLQNRMLERLAHLLYPGMIAVNPACGIVQLRSSEPSVILFPDEQFVYKSSGTERKRDSQTGELFFSPFRAVNIVDGSLKYMASARELYKLEDGMQKFPVSSSRYKMPDFQHTLWLGIDLNESVSGLRDLSFYFSWINQSESETFFQYLPYTNWSIQKIPLRHKQDLSVQEESEEPQSQLETEFDAMRLIRNQTHELFKKHYLTITTPETLDQMKVNRILYPSEFEKLFEEKALKEFRDPLLWIKIDFPTHLPEEALDNIFCSMNAVPVLNRKLNSISYKLFQNLNIVPLETEGSFLSIKDITNSQGQTVKLVPFANPAGLKPETYTLRYGINRFDERDSFETLVNLTELIREESSFFSSLGQDFLSQHIRDLNQILARIEDKIKMQNKNQSPYPYLIIRPSREGSNVMIEFWSCNGEAANKIPVGSKLSTYRHSNAKPNSICFITSTFGGRDKLNDAGKIAEYKKSLLSHNRIVTLQDLKTFVQAELGDSASSIEYKKEYVKGTKWGEGFIQCMQIIINPRPGSPDRMEWKQKLNELQLKLEKQSANNIPYHLKLQDQ
jgi:hypothetical protein